jgi:hypothetical protein
VRLGSDVGLVRKDESTGQLDSNTKYYFIEAPATMTLGHFAGHVTSTGRTLSRQPRCLTEATLQGDWLSTQNVMVSSWLMFFLLAFRLGYCPLTLDIRTHKGFKKIIAHIHR